MEKELLPFIHDPYEFAKKYDKQQLQLFYEKVNKLIGQDYIEKSPKILASEVVKAIFDGLALDSLNNLLRAVYDHWTDSVTYKESFQKYLANYSLPKEVDIWKVDACHPFYVIDEQWLRVIGENLHNKDMLKEMHPKIQARITEQKVRTGLSYLSNSQVLISFDDKSISYLDSFDQCCRFYTTEFYKLDSAMRGLYAEFLNKKELLEPFQEYYKNKIAIFLDKWFKYFDSYEQTQTGLLDRLINEPSPKTAIIIGDGVSYEIAMNIVSKVSKHNTVQKEIVLTDLPSETENNMSQIYMRNGAVEQVHSKREKFFLEDNADKTIGIIQLEDITDELPEYEILLCTYKDFDAIGEKMQHKALKYFEEAENCFAEKVDLLLNSGFDKVYLISDHGFVLTGILNEADKIDIACTGVAKKSERYIRTVEKQSIDTNQLIEREQSYGEYNYLYLSKLLNPFKTPGVYGFSHGGATPQEIITPLFCWERKISHMNRLSVSITNKTELESVTGELFEIGLSAGSSKGELFSSGRKVYLVFFSGGEQYQKSDIINLSSKQRIDKVYSFDGHKKVDVLLLDAETKEQLDKATIVQDRSRDLGGLL